LDPLKAERRGGWPGPRKPSLDVRFDPDLLARITAYAERHGISRGEVVRRATTVGMDTMEAADAT
jgi:hypothetical protein